MIGITGFITGISGQAFSPATGCDIPNCFMGSIMPSNIPPYPVYRTAELAAGPFRNTRFNQVMRAAFNGQDISEQDHSKLGDRIIFDKVISELRPKFENFIRENPGKRFILTIDGAPGSGKESVATGLYSAVSALSKTSRLEVDDFLHAREKRSEIAKDKGFTTNKFCTGHELRFDLLQKIVDQLSDVTIKQEVSYERYTRDSKNKERDGTLQLHRRSFSEKDRILLVDGSHASKLKAVHHKVFLDVSPEANEKMRLARDMRSRNTGNLQQLKHEAKSAVEQSQKYIIPSKLQADTLLRWGEEVNDNGLYPLELVLNRSSSSVEC